MMMDSLKWLKMRMTKIFNALPEWLLINFLLVV